jgi:copper chaperone CopZ
MSSNSQNHTTLTLQIVGMHCTSCAMNIDFELEDLDGVQSANTNYAKAITKVTFDPKKITVDMLSDTIRKLKYDVKPI